MNNQQIRFIKNGILIWSLKEIILNLSLLVLSILISFLISNICSLPLKYFLWKEFLWNKKSESQKIKRFLIFSLNL